MTLEHLIDAFDGMNLGDTEEIDRIRRELLDEIERQAADVDPEAVRYAESATHQHEIVDAVEFLVEECELWLDR